MGPTRQDLQRHIFVGRYLLVWPMDLPGGMVFMLTEGLPDPIFLWMFLGAEGGWGWVGPINVHVNCIHRDAVDVTLM